MRLILISPLCVLFLAGCVSTESLQLQQSSLTDPPRQICKTVRENEMRAESLYKGKRFTANAIVSNIQEGSMRYGSYSDYKSAAHSASDLPKDKTYEVSLTVDEGKSSGDTDPISIVGRTGSRDGRDHEAIINLPKGQKVQISGIITRFYRFDIRKYCTIYVDCATFTPL